MANLKTLLNENNQNIKNYIDAIKIKYNSVNKQIILSNGKNVESIIDATDFIKDGMINGIENDGENLIISWNTDAGIETTKIALIDLITNNSITNKHIAENASIDRSKLATDVQTSLDKADTAIQSLDGYAKIGINSDGYNDNTIYGAKAYAEYYADNLTEISTTYSSIKLAENGYKVEIQADLGVDIKTTGTNSSITFDTNHVIVPEPINNEDASNKKYVDDAIANADISANLTDYVKQEQLNDYVTDSELTSTLTGYAKKDEITGDIIVSNDWTDIENKPANLATTDDISNLSNGLETKISKTEDIIKETNNWNFQNTSISNINSISGSGATISYYYGSYSTIKLEADSSSISMNRGLHITGDYALNLSTNNSQVPDSLSITSANSILLNVGSTDDSYIKANGNIQLPSNYSILDENGNDRLVNQSSINTSINDNGLIFKSENDLNNNGFSLTKSPQDSTMLDFYFSGINGTLSCAGGLSLGGNDGIAINSSREISIQAANSSLIINDNEIKLSAISVPIYLNTISGVKTYNQLEIEKARPDTSIGHSSIILYDDNDNKYEVYVNTSGALSCKKITTT